MSYEIVRSCRINLKKEEIVLVTACNNIRPLMYNKWHFTSNPALDFNYNLASFIREYLRGDIQGNFGININFALLLFSKFIKNNFKDEEPELLSNEHYERTEKRFDFILKNIPTFIKLLKIKDSKKEYLIQSSCYTITKMRKNSYSYTWKNNTKDYRITKKQAIIWKNKITKYRYGKEFKICLVH